ncbi:MAG: 50S ribosomal protein L35 [Patescibacteria group bacterium]
MRKAFLKRFKITKRGKILRRKPGLNHNMSKKERIEILRRKKKVREDKLVLDYSYYKK